MDPRAVAQASLICRASRSLDKHPDLRANAIRVCREDLRASAFRVCREEKPTHFSGYALDILDVDKMQATIAHDCPRLG